MYHAKKKIWPLKSSGQALSLSETECVSCGNNTPLNSDLFFRYSISFNRFFDDQTLTLTLLFAVKALLQLSF